MIQKGDARETKMYVIVAIFIIIVVAFAVLLSNNNFTSAYVPDGSLGYEWNEDLGKRDSSSQFFGLEKFSSLTYRIDGNYPAYLMVITVKTIVLMSENELRDKTIEIIGQAFEDGITVDEDTEIIGERVLKNEHNTMYAIYDGNDNSKNPPEQIKIIGEIWNCRSSGTSVICMGVAQITDNSHNNSEINTIHWEKIIKDKLGTFGTGGFQGIDGLLYTVICH